MMTTVEKRFIYLTTLINPNCMNKIILSLSLILAGSLSFAQKECECLGNTYEVVGELSHKESNTEYYAGIKDEIVYFTKISYSNEEVTGIIISSIPAEVVNLAFNQLFTSKSKTVENDGYIEVTLGGSFKDSRNNADYANHQCYAHLKDYPSLAHTIEQRTTAIGTISSKEKLIELTDQIKEIQGL